MTHDHAETTFLVLTPETGGADDGFFVTDIYRVLVPEAAAKKADGALNEMQRINVSLNELMTGDAPDATQENAPHGPCITVEYETAGGNVILFPGVSLAKTDEQQSA